MLPHSRVIILPFSLVQSLGLVREIRLSFSESRMVFEQFHFLCVGNLRVCEAQYQCKGRWGCLHRERSRTGRRISD